MGLLSELKRRNVFRMAALYLVSAWLVMQVAEVVIGLANLPDWIGPLILVLLGVGLPIALVLSWFYELTPEGIELDKDVAEAAAIRAARGRRVDFVVIALLAAAVVMFAWDKWWPEEVLEQSIAVLAFDNMSDDPAQEYFSDGISEELLDVLAKIPKLRVTSRSSSFSFKNRNVPISDVAEQLNVSHVLEGSVRKAGDRVRITAQLIEARSDTHVWSETYDRELGDIFAVQNEIAEAIVGALRLRLASPADEFEPSVAESASMSAYDAYLMGRQLIRMRDYDAVDHLHRAIRLDDSFAPAHAQLAIAMLMGGRGTPETVRRHIDQAQLLEPDLPEAHAARSLAVLLDGDPAAAEEHARKALASNPNYVDAMSFLEGALAAQGQYAESDAIIEQMLAVDPMSVIARNKHIAVLNSTGRFREAHAMADRMLADDQRWGYFLHAGTSFNEGDVDQGLAWGFRVGKEFDNPYYIWAAFLQGEYDEARRFLADYDHWVDAAEGNWDAAVEQAEQNAQREPDNWEYILTAADMLYMAGRVVEALPLYERLCMPKPDVGLTFDAPSLGPIAEPIPVIRYMRIAFGRRLRGDEGGAQSAAELARQGHHILTAAGRRNKNRDLAEAMLAAFDGRKADAIAALRAAVEHGLRWRWFLGDVAFEIVRDEPGFAALRKDLDAIVATEREQILQLICFNNPYPNEWQPLPETCAGVTEQPGLLEFR